MSAGQGPSRSTSTRRSLPEAHFVAQLLGESVGRGEERRGRFERGDHAPFAIGFVPGGIELFFVDGCIAEVAVDDRVGPQDVRADRVRRGQPAPVISALGVIEPPDMALGKRFVAAGDFVQPFAAQGHIRQRGAQLERAGPGCLPASTCRRSARCGRCRCRASGRGAAHRLTCACRAPPWPA